MSSTKSDQNAEKMKYYLLILAILLSSCSVAKRAQRLYEKHPELVPVIKERVRDSVYKEIEKLVEVPIPVPGEERIIEVPVDCPDQDIIEERVGQAYVKAKIRDGVLTYSKFTPPDTVYVKVPYRDVTITSSESSIKEIPVKYIPKIWKILGWLGIAEFLLILLFFFLKLKRIL